MLTNTLQHIDEVVVWIDGVQPTGHQQTLHEPTCLAPSSVQLNNQFLRLSFAADNAERF